MQEFDRVYQEHSRDLFKFLFRVLGSKEEARELTQETFLAFLKEIRAEEMPQSKQRPWLYRVAKNKALNIRRERQRFASAQQRIEVDEEQMHNVTSTTRTTPEHHLSKAQERELVRQALTQMKERDADILQLYMAGLNYTDIAEAMGFERSTIGKALARAKESFKALYGRNVVSNDGS